MTTKRLIAPLIIGTLMLKSLHLQGADTAEREVRLLIDAIAASHCDFTRNGRQHTAEEAATHLALGTRHLALGTWHSALGTWHLALGTWNLELGTWNLELGTQIR